MHIKHNVTPLMLFRQETTHHFRKKKITNTYIVKTCLFGVPVHHSSDVADLIQNE